MNHFRVIPLRENPDVAELNLVQQTLEACYEHGYVITHVASGYVIMEAREE